MAAKETPQNTAQLLEKMPADADIRRVGAWIRRIREEGYLQ